MTLPIKTAAELLDLALPGSWTARREARQDAVLRAVWQHFLDRGGPAPIAEIERAVGDRPPHDVRTALTELDAADLLVLADREVSLAYPFSTGPNEFAVEVAPGVQRYAFCAIDALGLAPMLGRAITVRSRCHHCGDPLEISMDEDGPRSLPEAMVWVAPREACGPRVATGL